MSDSSDEEETTEHRKQSLANQQNSKPIVIKQNVKNPVRKGPYAIKRKLDPNAVVIQRRFGSKPIFDRDDVQVNTSPKTPQKNLQKKKTISPNPGPEHYGKNNRKNHSSFSRKDRSYSPKRKRTPEKKIPYFVDPVREQDRIRAKHRRPSRSHSRSHSRTRNRSRSHSRSPSSRSRRRHRSRSRSYHRNYSRHRTPSRERYRKRRSRTRSHSPSRNRSRRTPPYENPTPQFIPVPVPIEYAAAPPPRWIPPLIYPRYPMMPRTPMYSPYIPYYPGLCAPVPPPQRHNYPRYRGRPNRSN